MADEIGRLFETSGDMRCEWEIPDFTSLPQEIDKSYYSPRFLFSNACWYLRIDVYGESEKSKGWVGLYLVRDDSGPPKDIRFSLGIKRTGGAEESVRQMEKRFSKNKVVCGTDSLISRHTLRSKEKVLLPSDVLTIICTMNSDDAHRHMENSLFGSLWNLRLRCKNILLTRKRTDVVLKLKDGELSAHRIVLQSGSEVFNRMFGVDMRESQTGEVSIEDGNEEAFKVVLSYVYSGEPEGLCSENVYEVYKAAHKYDLRELRKFCVDIIERSLTADVVSDVIEVAELYQDATLKNCGKIFFAKNKTDVLKTEKWARIKKEYPALAFEVLEYDYKVGE